MTRQPVSPGLWMLWAAPAMLAAAFLLPGWGEGGALLIWTALGEGTLPRRNYPYVHKRRRRAHKLFFCCAFCWMLSAAAETLIRRALPSALSAPAVFAARFGAVFIGLSPAGRLTRLSVPRRIAWPCGAASCLAAALLIALQTG